MPPKIKFGKIQRVGTSPRGPKGTTVEEFRQQKRRTIRAVEDDPERFKGTRTEAAAEEYKKQLEARRKRKAQGKSTAYEPKEPKPKPRRKGMRDA